MLFTAKNLYFLRNFIDFLSIIRKKTKSWAFYLTYKLFDFYSKKIIYYLRGKYEEKNFRRC